MYRQNANMQNFSNKSMILQGAIDMIETTKDAYRDFLDEKSYVLESTGFQVSQQDLNPKLFQYQKDIVRWALAKGKAAVF